MENADRHSGGGRLNPVESSAFEGETELLRGGKHEKVKKKLGKETGGLLRTGPVA